MKSLLFAFTCCSLTLFASSKPKNSDKATPDKMGKPGNCPMSHHCNRMSYEFFGELLYLQPNGSSLYYAAEAFPFDTSIAVPAVSPNWKIFEIDPDYTPGFEVGFRSFFPTHDTNLEINWERLHTHDKDSMTTPTSGDMVGPMFDIGPNSAVYSSAKGKAVFNFDKADLLFGKKICLYERLRVNLQAGASFARIKQTVTSHYENSDGLTSRIITSPSTFTGAGTKFGFDFDFQICKNFCFTGDSSVSLVMGQLKNHTIFKSFAPSLNTLGIPQPNRQKTTVENRSQLIPGFEEKLGFAYAVKFNNCSRLTFGLGYQFQIYLNAIQTVDMTAPQVLPSLTPGIVVRDGVYAVGFERTLSNFILSGPYFSANISF